MIHTIAHVLGWVFGWMALWGLVGASMWDDEVESKDETNVAISAAFVATVIVGLIFSVVYW